jgi:hypothetical protein
MCCGFLLENMSKFLSFVLFLVKCFPSHISNFVKLELAVEIIQPK